jgi:hypothetical protein
MLALSLIAVAAVFVSLRSEDDEANESSDASEIDTIHRGKARMQGRAQLR